MCNRVEASQTLGDLRAGDRIHQSSGVVVDVAAIADVAARARFPKPSMDQTAELPIKYGVSVRCCARWVGDDRAEV